MEGQNNMDDTTDRDLRECKLNEFDTSDRDVGKSNGGTAVRASS